MEGCFVVVVVVVFFFCFALFKTTKICFGSTKMGIFYREKAFHVTKKIWKNDFAPSEKYSSYASEQALGRTGYWTKWTLDEVGMGRSGIGRNGYERSGSSPPGDVQERRLGRKF